MLTTVTRRIAPILYGVPQILNGGYDEVSVMVDWANTDFIAGALGSYEITVIFDDIEYVSVVSRDSQNPVIFRAPYPGKRIVRVSVTIVEILTVAVLVHPDIFIIWRNDTIQELPAVRYTGLHKL